MGDLIEELVELLQEDGQFFESTAEIENTREMLRTGTSAGRQRQAYSNALHAEDDQDHAMRAVVRHLIEEFHADL
jgi:carboxylate-amine ligase